jgi:hypothetical protein
LFLCSQIWHLNRSDNILIECISNYKEAATFPIGSIDIRFESAIHWAEATAILGERSCLDAYSRAMDLISTLAWVGGSIAQQHRKIWRTLMSELGRNAARIAAGLGKFSLAVEWLERSRSIVWSQMLNVRKPIDDLLYREHPALAQRLRGVVQGMEVTSALINIGDGARQLQHQGAFQEQDVIGKYHRLAQEWESLVAEVRVLLGLAGFLRPRTLEDLSGAARGGPVVVLNVHTSGCDALILKDEQVFLCLRLDFTADDAAFLQANFRDCIRSSSARSRGDEQAGSDRSAEVWHPPGGQGFPHILSELWIKVVKPVLDVLDIPVRTRLLFTVLFR